MTQQIIGINKGENICLVFMTYLVSHNISSIVCNQICLQKFSLPFNKQF